MDLRWTDLADTNEGEIWENAVRPIQAGTVVRRFYGAGSDSPDTRVEAVLKVLSFDVGPQAGVIGRFVASAEGYEAIYDGIEMQWELRHLWGSEVARLGARPEVIEQGMHTLTLQTKGDLVELLVEGEAKISVRDFSVTGIGQSGIMLFQRDEGEKMSGIHIDSIKAWDI